jgi:hypothetical protein
MADDQGNREIHQPLAEELLIQQHAIKGMRSGMTRPGELAASAVG